MCPRVWESPDTYLNVPAARAPGVAVGQTAVVACALLVGVVALHVTGPVPELGHEVV